MTTVSSNKSSISFYKIVALVLALSPILQTYGWGKYDFTFILTTMLSLLAIAQGMIKLNNLPKFLLLYIVYWLIIHEISATSLSEAIPLGVVRTLLVFGLFFSVIKFPLFIKYYSAIVHVSLLFFFFQVLIKLVTGINFLGVFNFLPLALDTDAASYFQDRMDATRLSSFFSEPAHFAQYLLPYLAIQLFNNQLPKKKRIIEICIIIITLLLLQSGNAFFGLAVCLAVFLLYRMKGSVSQKAGSIVLGAMVVAGVFAFSRTELGQNLMSRKDQISLNSVDKLGYSTSGFERIYRGYFMYAEYSAIRKIIGNDNPEYKKAAAERSPLSVTYIAGDYLYYNTIQAYLLNTGLIGLIIMLLVYKNIFVITDRCGKCILLTFVAMNFIASSYFNEIMCIYLLLPTLMSQNKWKIC